MPLLRNAATGNLEMVADGQVQAALAAGSHQIDKRYPVQVQALRGQGGVTSPEQLAALAETTRGEVSVVPESTVRSQESAAYEADRFGGAGEALAAFETGALDTLTFGGFSAANRLGGDELARSARQHPNARLAGEIVGGVVAGRPTGALSRTAPGVAARAGRAVAGEGAGILRTGAGTAVEGAILGAGSAVGERAISEDPLNAERAISAIGSGMLLGGIAGGTTGVTGKAAEKGLLKGKVITDEAIAARRASARAADQVDDLAALDARGLREAEKLELARIDAERVPDRAAIAREIGDARQAAKGEKPWLALEGFKGKKGAKGAAPVEPPPRGTVTRDRLSANGRDLDIEVVTRPASSKPFDDDFLPPPEAGVPEKTYVRITRDLGDGERVTVADAEFSVRPGELYPDGLNVEPAFRRQGLASRMYEEAQKSSGRARIVESATQTEMGAAFRQGMAAKGPKLGPMTPEFAREVREISRITLEADQAVDRLLRNPKRLAEKPWLAEGALQQQEHALERLQAAAPELRMRIQADPKQGGSRLAALDTVDPALERNRALQERLRAIAADPASPRLEAIRTARDSLVGGQPGPSMGEHLARGGIFTGVTAAAHAAGLGFGAPILGAAVARQTSRLIFGRLGAASRHAAERTGKAIESILTVGRKVAPAAVPVASRTLRRIAMAPAGDREPRDLAGLFAKRRAEVLSQVERGLDGKLVMRESARQAVAQRLSGLAALDPKLADKAESHAALRATYKAEKLPRPPELPGVQIGSHPHPLVSERQMRTWARINAVVDDPGGFEERIASGNIIPEEAEAYRDLYPERWADLRQRVIDALPTLRRTLPMERKLALTILTGVPVDPAFSPGILRVMQGIYSQEPGTEQGTQAPIATPQTGSISREQPTPAQRRAGGE